MKEKKRNELRLAGLHTLVVGMLTRQMCVCRSVFLFFVFFLFCENVNATHQTYADSGLCFSCATAQTHIIDSAMKSQTFKYARANRPKPKPI